MKKHTRWFLATTALILPLAVAKPAGAIVPAHIVTGAQRSPAGDVLALQATDAGGGSGVGIYTPAGRLPVTITFDCVVVKGEFIWGGNLVPVTGDFAFLSGLGTDGHRYYVGVMNSTVIFQYQYLLSVDVPAATNPCGATVGSRAYPDLPSYATSGAIVIEPYDPLAG